MKKFLFFVTACCVLTFTFAATSINVAPKNANEVYLPIGENARISLADLAEISVKDFQAISGQKMNFFDKLTFKAGQKKLKKSISEDGTITNKKLAKVAADMSSGFHIGGFALGFFVGLIGVLIAYLIKGDEAVDKNRRKWAWIGFAAWVVILLIALAV